MRELSHVERWVAFWAGIVTIIGGLASFASMTGLWSRPPMSPGGIGSMVTELTTTREGEVEDTGGTLVEFGPSPTPRTETAPPQATPRLPQFPVQARLEDGQQYVMLAGDLGIGATFSEVASTPIATLRLNHEGTSELKALQMAGDAFTVTVHGTQYRISVLSLRFETREITVQIDKIY
jgi:hypothetical protein